MIFKFRMPVFVTVEADSEEQARLYATTSTQNWDDWDVDDGNSSHKEAEDVPELLETIRDV